MGDASDSKAMDS